MPRYKTVTTMKQLGYFEESFKFVGSITKRVNKQARWALCCAEAKPPAIRLLDRSPLKGVRGVRGVRHIFFALMSIYCNVFVE